MTLETQYTGFGLSLVSLFTPLNFNIVFFYPVVDLKRVAINGSELLSMWGRRDLFGHDDYLWALADAKKYWIQ